LKYIDRIRIGLELYMDRLSPLTSCINTRPPESAAELLMAENYPDLHAECRRIHAGLRHLTSDGLQLTEVLTQRVAAIARSPYTPTPEHLVPLFRWVQALRESNKLARNRWLSELQYCCDGCAPYVTDILRSFAEISAQRISLLPDGNTLTLSLPSSLWGDVSLRFTGISPEQMFATPRFGYLFWIEGERTAAGRQFRLLMDEAFSDTDYQDRLLQHEDWAELEFTCDTVEADIRTYDYTARALHHGFSGYNAMILCFGELLRKYFTLGQNGLNGSELRLIAPAMFFYRLEMIPNAYILNDHLPPTTQLFEQHYQLKQMITFFERECSKTGERIAQLLEKAADGYADEYSDNCHKHLQRLRKLLHLLVEAGDIGTVSERVLKLLQLATCSYTDRPTFADHYVRLQEYLEQLVPILENEGFSGTFPNYQRKHGSRIQMISFLSDFMPTVQPGGPAFNVSLAVAEYNPDQLFTLLDDETYTCQGASDFIETRDHFLRFGSVCNPQQDGIRCCFLLDGDTAQWAPAAMELTAGLQRALMTLNGRLLPESPRPHTRAFLRRNHTFAGLFEQTLPWGLPIAAVLIFWQWPFCTDIVPVMLMTLAALGAGMLFAALLTVIRFRRFRRRIWRR
jgi:hypothetical protein